MLEGSGHHREDVGDRQHAGQVGDHPTHPGDLGRWEAAAGEQL